MGLRHERAIIIRGTVDHKTACASAFVRLRAVPMIVGCMVETVVRVLIYESAQLHVDLLVGYFEPFRPNNSRTGSTPARARAIRLPTDTGCVCVCTRSRHCHHCRLINHTVSACQKRQTLGH